MQTLSQLHERAGVAHLDISTANLRLTPEAPNTWEKLRLLDFGYAQTFQAGVPSHAHSLKGCMQQCLPLGCAADCMLYHLS